MIGGEDDDRVGGEPQPLNGIEHPAGLSIDITDTSQVSAYGGPPLLRCRGDGIAGYRAVASRERYVGFVVSRLCGERDVVDGIKVKIFRWGDQWQVRPVKANREEERLRRIVFFEPFDGRFCKVSVHEV